MSKCNEYMSRLYSQLSAAEAIGGTEGRPHLNRRGQRLLNWLRARRARGQ